MSAIFQLHIWGPKAKEILITADNDKTSATFCGLKLKDKKGNWRTFILTQKMLTYDENDDVILSFITAEEITYFHKSYVVWYRVTGNPDVGPGTRVFFLNGAKKEAVDLFTNRELDILNCTAAKMSIREIAEQLELSKNTVERHRKNMIAKVGVTNMTGVIRISQILNLV